MAQARAKSKPIELFVGVASKSSVFIKRKLTSTCTRCTADSFASLINQSLVIGLHLFEIDAIFPAQLGRNEFQGRLRLL